MKDEIQRMREIAVKLETMGKELIDSGIIGYGLSLKEQSRILASILKEIDDENERIRLSLYLKDREQGLTLW